MHRDTLCFAYVHHYTLARVFIYIYIYIYICICHLPKRMPKTQSDYSYHVQDVAEALALLDMRVFNMARMHGATERPWGLGVAPREMWFHRILKVNEDMYKHI